MVTIEAAAHGTPTVAFATGGIDEIKDGVSGYLIEKENYQDLTTTTVCFLHYELSIDALQCTDYAELFSWYHLSENFNRVLRKI